MSLPFWGIGESNESPMRFLSSLLDTENRIRLTNTSDQIPTVALSCLCVRWEFLVGQLIFFLPWLCLEAYHDVALCKWQREDGCCYSEWRPHAEECIWSDISCPMHRNFRMMGHWHRLPRGSVDAPSLAVPCTMLDGTLWIWSTGGIPVHGGVGVWWTLRSLPIQTSPWFCDSFYEMCGAQLRMIIQPPSEYFNIPFIAVHVQRDEDLVE